MDLEMMFYTSFYSIWYLHLADFVFSQVVFVLRDGVPISTTHDTLYYLDEQSSSHGR
jgi:hypothetical protein